MPVYDHISCLVGLNSESAFLDPYFDTVEHTATRVRPTAFTAPAFDYASRTRLLISSCQTLDICQLADFYVLVDGFLN